MRSVLVATAALLLASSVAAQSVIQAGQRYPGGTRVLAPAAGVSFQVPANLQGGYDPAAEAFLISSQSQPNTVVAVLAYSEGTVEEVGDVVMELLSEQGMQLQPRGEPQFDGTTLRATFTVWAGGQQGVLIGTIRSGPPGNTVAIIGFGPQPEESAIRRLCDGVLESTSFSAPLAAQWRQQFGGTRLVYLGQQSNYSPGGVGDASYVSQREERYDFCRNGGYAYYMKDESYFSVEGVGGMSSTEEDGHQGSWRLVADIVGAAYLILEATDGQIRQYAVEERQDGVVVGEGLYRVEQSPACY